MPFSILTQRNGSDRKGVNQQPPTLRPTNVNLNTFGKIGSYPVDGDVYAQPLYVARVITGRSKVSNLLIVATMNNTVFAFDANAKNPNNAQVWRSPLGSPVFAPQFVGGAYRDIVDAVDPGAPFRQHTATIGILSTPVIEAQIDPAGVKATTGTIYLVTFTVDDESFQKSHSAAEFKHFLHALNLADGQPVRQAVQIEGKVSGQGYARGQGCAQNKYALRSYVKTIGTSSVTSLKVGDVEVEVVGCENVDSESLASVKFNSIMQLQRPALLLHSGVVIVAFGSRQDENPYHGWIFAYDAKTFGLVGLLCTTPNGSQGGIWQAGQGPLVDSKGKIYAGSGNGDSAETIEGTGLQGRNLAESFVQLELGDSNIRLRGWFNAFDDFHRPPNAPAQTWYTDPDDDLGASAPALLPDDRIVGGGKDGWFYLIDPDLLNKTGSQNPSAVPQAFKASFNFERGSRNRSEERRV